MRWIILTLLGIPLAVHSSHVVRAAIDVGSGGPKLRVAEVDLTTHKIVKVLHVQQYPVFFQECLSHSGSKILTSEIMAKGITAIKEALGSAHSFGVEGVVAIGTSVFRNAVNGPQFADDIYQETGLKLYVLDQDLEGKLAFHAALAKTNTDINDLIVWDIGGGSTQFISATGEGSYLVEGIDDGSGPFRDFIIESIQSRSLKEYKSPNPISSAQAILAEDHVRSLAEKVDQVFKDKISQPTTRVIGVGSVLGRGIAALMRTNTFTIEALTSVVNALVGKTDADLGDGDFACIEVSNALLALGYMKGLNIQQMTTIDVNNADGAMLYERFW